MLVDGKRDWTADGCDDFPPTGTKSFHCPGDARNIEELFVALASAVNRVTTGKP